MLKIVMLTSAGFFFKEANLSFINLKPLYTQFKEDNNYLPFQKTNKSIKIDINGISDPLEMYKNIISA